MGMFQIKKDPSDSAVFHLNASLTKIAAFYCALITGFFGEAPGSC